MTPPDRVAPGGAAAADLAPGFDAVFAGLPVAVIVVDPADRVAHANTLAEELLNRSERVMRGRPLGSILPPPVEGRSRDGQPFAAYDTEIETAPGSRLRIDFAEAAIVGHPGWRTITLHPLPARHHASSGSARTATGAAAMLAHEIRNPLSGIRGAAQLIGTGELPDLIVREVDRIAALIDRMQAFGDERPLPLSAENIYPLIDHARRLALAGPARSITIEERFDPSLPMARINADALLQVLINLINNAVQALGGVADPRIVLTTAFRHGMAVRTMPGGDKVALPIEIAVVDNGPGAPADLADHLFEPFVSGRPEGQGLGLALVEKLVRDMGGIVRYAREGSPALTVFRVLLPRGSA